MARLYFSGLVLPERVVLSVSEVRSQVVDAAGTPRITIALNIWNNQISAVVDTEEPDIFSVRNIVRREAEFITDVAGFLMGHAYDVEITKAFGPELEPTQVFGIEIPVLVARAKGRDLGALVNTIFPLCFGPEARYLRRCLTDLAFAIKRPDDTAFYCFRALESLRHSFGTELPESEQWKAMAAALRTCKNEMRPLREHAFPARHGDHRALTDEDRQRYFLYTWDVVERYIDYRLVAADKPPVFFEAPEPPA